MFDKYLYRVEKDGAFYAGYTLCKLSGNTHPVFLFTSLRIIKVLSGAAQWKIGSEIYVVQKDDIVVVNNIQPRQFMNVLEAPFECEIFAFSPAVFQNASDCLSLFYNQSDKFNPVISKSIANSGEIYTLLAILKSRFQSASRYSQYSIIGISGILSAIFSHVLMCIEQASPDMLHAPGYAKSYAAKIAAQSIEYINKNISKEIDVSVLAKNANLSRVYFSKVFHKYTGITPASFISRCRINNVIHLLSTQDINVLDAALASGFKTSSGFYKTFHAICGMPPKAFLLSGGAAPVI